MADLILVAITLGFIALCVAYISWCDRIIGPDDFGSDVTTSAPAADTARPASTSKVTSTVTSKVTS